MSDPHERALVILGDYRHFTGSLLAKLAGRAFEPLPVTAWHDDGRDTAFINWTPEMHRPVSDAERALVPRRARIINDTHFNSDKRNVQAHMHRVFGYTSAVVPLSYCGPGVIKSNRNARHDGRVVQFPLARLEAGDVVYERLIRNQYDAEVRDIRIPVILGRVPYAYLKWRPVARRFSNKNTRVNLVPVDAALSAAELKRCLAFARLIGLDYGELDILRSRDDGLIYIVDANNTPHGPPNGLPEPEADRALRMYAEAIGREVFHEAAPAAAAAAALPEPA